MHALVASAASAVGGNGGGAARSGGGYRWPSLSSPSSMSDDDDEHETGFSNEMHMKVDGRNSRPSRAGAASSTRPAPLASDTDKAASLQSAFCRRAISQASRNTGSHVFNEDKSDYSSLGLGESLDENLMDSKCNVQALLDDSRNVFGDDGDFIIDSPPTMIKCELSSFSGNGSLHLNQSCMYFDCSSPTPQATAANPRHGGIGSPPASATGDASQLDIYRDLILRHLIQDIKSTCAKLALPTDPQQWSAEQSGRWISEMAAQFQLAAPPRQLCLAGRSLCAMNQDEFLARAPCGGDTLHAQLQLWKTATETYHTHQNHNDGSGNACNVTDSSMKIQKVNMNRLQSNCRSIVPGNGATGSELGQLSLTEFLNNFNPSTGDTTSTNIGPGHHVQQLTGSCGESLLLNSQHQTQQQQHHHQQQQQHQQMLYFRGQPQSTLAFQRSNQASMPQQPHLLPSPANSDPSDSGISADSYNDDDGSLESQQLKHLQQQLSGPGRPGGLLPPHHLLGHHVMAGGQPPTPMCTGPPTALVTPTGNIHLWQFIRELLDNPVQFSACVRWLDRKEGIFKIESSHQLARLWGQRKNRTKMNYDKLSRSLRQYYKKNIIKKTGQKQRLIYQFIPPYHFA